MAIRLGSTPITPDAPQAPERGSVASQGLRSGLLQSGAGFATLGATGLDALGAGGMAKDLYAQGHDLRQQGIAAAPEIQSVSQVHDVDSALKYSVGLLAQGAPMIGTGLLGAALTRGRAPMLGATAAAVPFTAGDLAVRQQEDPVAARQDPHARFKNAMLGGTANAALGMAVPTMMGGKLLGRGLAAEGMTLGQNVASNVGTAVVGNAAAGALGEKVNQEALTALNANRDTSNDKQMLIDAGAGGAVTGIPFAGAGIVGEAARGKRPAARTDGIKLDGAAPKETGTGAVIPPDAPTPAPAAPKRLVDRFKDAFKKDDATLEREAVDHVATDRDIIDADVLSRADPETQGQMLKEADDSRVSKVTDWAKQMYEDANLAPESRAAIDDFMANPADRAKQAAVAGMKQASDASTAVAAKAKEFGDFVSSKYKEAKGGEKRSEQFSPQLHNLMADTIAPALAERFPALVQNDAHMQTVTRGLRRVMDDMQQTGKVDGDTVEQLHGWFGDDAPSVMASLHERVLSGGDEGATAKYFGALNQMTDEMSTARSIEGQVKAALPEGVDASPAMVKELIRGLREHMDGADMKGKTKEQAEFDTREIETTLRAQFGAKTDGLLKAFEKDAKRRHEAAKLDQVEDVNDNMSERSVAEEANVEYRGGGKAKDAPELVESPEAHRAKFNSESAAERLIAKAKVEHPDGMVEFVKVKDLPEDMRAKYKDAGPDDGLVMIEKTTDETQISDREMKSVTIDTHSKTSHAANNASRIDTGVKGAVIDARALVKAMKRKLDYASSDDHGNRNRTARAFMEGVAAVQDRLKTTFDIPDSTVLEPGFTYGDTKKLSMRQPDPAWMKGKSDDEINAALRRGDALKELGDKELGDAVTKTQEVLEKREAAFMGKVQDLRESGTKLDKASYRELRKQMGVDDAKAALRAAEKEVTNREDAVRAAKLLEDEGRTEVDPNESITRVGDKEPRRAGLDDNPLQHENFVHGKNEDAVRKGGIESRASWLENLKTDGGKKNLLAGKVAEKVRALLGIMDEMRAMDKGLFKSIIADKDVASISEVVNDLAHTYRSKLTEKTEASAAYTGRDAAAISAIAKSLKTTSGALMFKYARQRERYEGRPRDVFERAFAASIKAKPEQITGLYDIYKSKEPAAKKSSAFTERVLGEGDLAPTLKAIKTSDDPLAVRRAIDALAEHADNPRARQVLDAANERMATLIERDPNAAYSLQRTDPNVSHTSKVLADVQEHINKVFGGRVDVEFKKMLHAGEFVRDKTRSAAGMSEDVIRVSVHALDPMGTAMHESMHALLRKMRDGGLMDAASPLMRAADSFAVKTRLRELLAGEPDALKQLGDLEERAAYMYQFWAAGKLDLAPKPAGVLGHIKAMLHKVMGMWTNDERAVHIMEYFQSGEYGKNMGDVGAVRRALMEGTNEHVESFRQMAKPLARLADAVFATGNGRLRGTLIPALVELADKVYSPLQGEHDDPGYVPAARIKQDQIMNHLAEQLHRFDEPTLTDALKSLQQGVKGNSAQEKAAMATVRKVLDDTFTYMRDAGVKVGDLGYGKDYFPRVWDADVILQNEQAFRDMLDHYAVKGTWSGNTDQLIATLTRTNGSELQIETVKPGMVNTKQRKLDFISALDAEPFMQKNLFHTLNNYVTQATRRAEWARRFQDDGSDLHALMKRAEDEGASKEDVQLASDYLEGVDGTLGDDINPKLRRAFGAAIVYQNIRVLPLMVFSSLIDPGGVLVRGGTVGEAFNTLKRGLKEIPKGFKKDAAHDEWTRLSATLGTIESAVLMKAVGSSYAQGMSGNVGRKFNDTFFKYNLMAQYNTSMRVGATEAAVNFLGRHADGQASTHSARWLAELGFKPGDVVVKNGRPLLTRAEFEAHGMKTDAAQAAADRMAIAVNKWVDGAVLRPNAAHKPVWMNDPHYALFSHLKQFVYSFQETILKRTINEARHGNIAPAYALAAYVPFMIAADLMKGMVIGGGSQPDYKEGWGVGDYVASGVQRAGLLGVGQIGADIATNVHRGGVGLGAVVGPTIEQLGDAAEVVAGPQQFKTFAVNALPANQLFDAAGEAVAP